MTKTLAAIAAAATIAAATLSKHVVENPGDDTNGAKNDELADLAKLTGLKVTRPKTQEQLETLVQQVCEKLLTTGAGSTARTAP